MINKGPRIIPHRKTPKEMELTSDIDIAHTKALKEKKGRDERDNRVDGTVEYHIARVEELRTLGYSEEEAFVELEEKKK